MAPTRNHRGLLLLGALGFGFAAATLLTLAVDRPGVGHGVALVALLVVAVAASRRLDGAERAATACVGAGVAAALLLGAVFALRIPLAAEEHALVEALVRGHVAALVFTILGAVIAAHPRAPAPTSASLRGPRIALLGLIALLAAAAGWSLRAPSPGAYPRSLELFARPPAQTQMRIDRYQSARSTCEDEFPVADLRVVRRCTGRCGITGARCALGVAARSPDFAPRPAEVAMSAMVLRNDAELTVRLDAARDLLLIDDGGPARLAIDLRAGRLAPLSAWSLAPPLAPPAAWIAFGFAGAVLAVLAQVLARRRPGAEPVEGSLRDDGTVVAAGRVVTGVASPPGVTPGPVVVFLARDLGTQHYRDGASQEGAHIEAGDLAAYRDRVTARAALWATRAWVIAALAAAPLAAWAFGAATARPMPATPRATFTARTIEGVRVEEFATGAGATVTPGVEVEVHYTGRLLDGTVFDDSGTRDRPFRFTYGNGQLIPGFERGMRGMRVGGRRRLTIPAELGYGERGRPPQIPPSATLVFDIELLAVHSTRAP